MTLGDSLCPLLSRQSCSDRQMILPTLGICRNLQDSRRELAASRSTFYYYYFLKEFLSSLFINWSSLIWVQQAKVFFGVAVPLPAGALRTPPPEETIATWWSSSSDSWRSTWGVSSGFPEFTQHSNTQA